MIFKIPPDYYIKKMLKSKDPITFSKSYFGFCEQLVNQSTYFIQNEVKHYLNNMQSFLVTEKD